MQSNDPQVWTVEEFDLLREYTPSVLDVFSKIDALSRADGSRGLEGVGAAAIIGGAFQEYHDRNEDLLEAARAGLGDYFALQHTHQGLNAHYLFLESNPSAWDIINQGTPLTDALRITEYPTSLDVGMGKIRIHSAISVVNEYLANNPNDELGFSKYQDRYDLLVRDLYDFRNTVTIKVSGLIARDAVTFYRTYAANWNQLSQAQREGLIAYYYRFGEERLLERANAAGPHGWNPNVDETPIAQEHILNSSQINGILSGSHHPADPTNPNAFDIDFCFSGDTLILLADGEERCIENVGVGDYVLAFDGLGALQPRRVVAKHKNIAREIFQLSNGLLVTPGHRFLIDTGEFLPIEQILSEGRPIVLANGSLRLISGKLIDCCSADVGAVERMSASGSTALAQVQEEQFWTTYNLTVDDLHTYVAGGVRVHNDGCLQPGDIPVDRYVDPSTGLRTVWATNRYGSQIVITESFDPIEGYRVIERRGDISI